MAGRYRNQITYSMMLRHAFMSGAGYGEVDKISSEDQKRWAFYEPPETPRSREFLEVIEQTATLRNALSDTLMALEHCHFRGVPHAQQKAAQGSVIARARELLGMQRLPEP